MPKIKRSPINKSKSAKSKNTEWRKLITLLGIEGAGSLAFVIIDNEEQRVTLFTKLQQDLASSSDRVEVIYLTSTQWNLPDLITKIDQSPSKILCVYGFENTPIEFLARELNYKREVFAPLNFPVVMWMLNPTLTVMARQAPDFWAWRRGVFDLREKKVLEDPGLSEAPIKSLVGDPPDHSDAITKLLDKIEEEHESAKSSKRGKDDRLLAKAYRELGDLYRRQGDLLLAVRALEAAQHHVEQIGIAIFSSRDYGRLLREYASICISIGAWDNARSALDHSTQIAEDNKDPKSIAQCALLQANLREALGDLQGAVEKYNRVVQLTESGDNSTTRILALRKLGNLLIYLREWERAVEVYYKANELCEAIHYAGERAAILNNLGVGYTRMGRLQEAINVFESSLQLKTELKDLRGAGITLRNMSHVYEKLQNYSKARECYARALELSRQATFVRVKQAQEIETIRKFRRRDKKVQSQVIDWILPVLRPRVATISRYANAEDLLQDTLMRVLASAERFEGNNVEQLRRWAVGILSRIASEANVRRFGSFGSDEGILVFSDVDYYFGGQLSAEQFAASWLDDTWLPTTVADIPHEFVREPERGIAEPRVRDGTEAVVIRDQEKRDMADLAWWAIGKLQPEEQLLVTMHYIDDVPLNDIAERLHVSRRTLTKRMSKIRAKLREVILGDITRL